MTTGRSVSVRRGAAPLSSGCGLPSSVHTLRAGRKWPSLVGNGCGWFCSVCSCFTVTGTVFCRFLVLSWENFLALACALPGSLLASLSALSVASMTLSVASFVTVSNR